jgi:PAS domain-containing protein
MSPRAEHTNSELAALFQALPDLVLTVEPDGTIVDIKPGLEEIPYMEAADLLGRRLQDIPIDSDEGDTEAVKVSQ